MKIVIFSDIHDEAPHSVFKKDSEMESEIYNPDMVKTKYQADKVFLTGDVIDVDNAKKKYVKRAREKVKKLQEIHGDCFVEGNHEAMTPRAYFRVHGDILILHGHHLVWPIDKVLKWENKKGGMSYWRYKFYQWTHHRKSGKTLKPKIEQLEKFSNLAKENNCKTIIWGHHHKSYDQVYNGVRLINVPKGRTILDV